MNREIDTLNKSHSNKNEPIRFFNNPILNGLSHTSLTTISIIYIPIILFFTYQSIIHLKILTVIFGFILGLFMWSFVEYLVHRFAFHFKFKREGLKRIHAIFHLAHHKYLQDATKYPTLLLVSSIGGLIFYYFLKSVFGITMEPIYAGFVSGYIVYECVHYSTHKLKMNTIIAKKLKQHHMRHHYFDDTKNFGVTSPLWDYVFNTHLKKNDMHNIAK